MFGLSVDGGHFTDVVTRSSIFNFFMCNRPPFSDHVLRLI